jgi:hypothetical protein
MYLQVAAALALPQFPCRHYPIIHLKVNGPNEEYISVNEYCNMCAKLLFLIMLLAPHFDISSSMIGNFCRNMHFQKINGYLQSV